jgi:hypothetical protein
MKGMERETGEGTVPVSEAEPTVAEGNDITGGEDRSFR